MVLVVSTRKQQTKYQNCFVAKKNSKKKKRKKIEKDRLGESVCRIDPSLENYQTTTFAHLKRSFLLRDILDRALLALFGTANPPIVVIFVVLIVSKDNNRQRERERETKGFFLFLEERF
jgi:hypothetical protein